MRFVDNLFGSKTRTQILRFFYRNQGVFSIRDIAEHLRLSGREVEKEIQILHRQKIIKKGKLSNVK